MSRETILSERYQLLERLGIGGMAIVYRAYDQRLERYVAIKLLRETYSSDSAFRERFHQEARAAANLSHPNIVTVHDFGYDKGQLYIVMEYVPGTDLKSYLKGKGHFSVRETLSLMIQACAGVGYAHRAGIVHCDIKPQNFLLTPDRRLKVTDFGIARALASIHPEEKSEVIWGSPQYFSPEQAAGLAPSPASDVYSLGVVAYEMLTGQLPFQSSSAEELARMHREDPPPPPSRYNPSIPPSLELVILKVLSKEPSARYRTADQLGRILIHVQNELYEKTTPSSTESMRKEPSVALTQRPPPPSSMPLLASELDGSHQMPLSLQSPVLPETPSDEIDWLTIFLGLIAVLAVGGLVPLWIWVFFLYQ
ncbi:MAG: protein kinase [Anaerolineales bacterium]|nr:protein kinase [Anaerolineales bacterium]MCS7246898.1 protein kinase [Anaerolineales bacterium]MDW8160709.1 protein kinase [Anaerolineales bacterium]MDW8445975.1 protein kinase [Anaerolineales bacterium]